MSLLFQAERRRTLLNWPDAVDERLELLVRAATAAGEQVSRSQMLAALVAATPVTPADLADLLRRYRTTPLGSFVAEHDRNDLPEVRHPGPRRAVND